MASTSSFPEGDDLPKVVLVSNGQPRPQHQQHPEILVSRSASTASMSMGMSMTSPSPSQSPRLAQKRAPVKIRRKEGGRAWYQMKRVKGVLGVIGLVGLFFLLNWLMLLRLPRNHGGGFINGLRSRKTISFHNSSSVSLPVQGEWKKFGKGKRFRKGTYDRMLALAAHALAENKNEPKDLWQEPFVPASAWRPCADQRNWEPSVNSATSIRRSILLLT